MVAMNSDNTFVKLLHHGAAANSQRGVLAWIPTTGEDTEQGDLSTLVYASHSVLNLTTTDKVTMMNGEAQEPVWHVKETLCTQTTGNDDGSRHVITCLASVTETLSENESTIFTAALVSGFADGTVTVWVKSNHGTWSEMTIKEIDSDLAITCVDALWVESQGTLLVLVGTSAGATLFECELKLQTVSSSEATFDFSVTRTTALLSDMAVGSVRFRLDPSMEQILALIGTAAPRHNKIHVLHASEKKEGQNYHFHYSGSLIGHEDWITCMTWTHGSSTEAPVLATGSQDARIRLWKFTTTTNDFGFEETPEEPELVPNQDDEELSDGDDDVLYEEEEEEGESRLDIRHNKYLTRVTLEALLVGHEEGITSVCWYKYSKPVYNQEHLLVSSSMDRSILLWTPGQDGIWSPLTRVGAAGGILGGSVGSSLLGYLSVALEPTKGLSMIGHAYGGALHVWNLSGADQYLEGPEQQQHDVETDDRVLSLYWKATPCITGHFSGVSDLCWETSAGQYLLTASDDQTCRLWAPAKSLIDDKRPIWLELARPQVHGYNIAAVTSVSCEEHPHFLVSGADEKELRGFDATQMSLRILEAVSGSRWAKGDAVERVERAYIPSLGLSNKASAADGAEEDTPDEISANTMSKATMKLPLERDLGVASLWPEVQKLFGHKTELYCVTSTPEAQSAKTPSSAAEVLVASSCKARDAEAAAIRLWRAYEGKCHQVLSEGGHKSTVATLAFSPDACLLASSGKDRRLCIWKRQEDGQYSLAWAKDSAHKRIIWSVDFLPWGDNRILASGSRDGTVKIWAVVTSEDGGEDASLLCSFSPTFTVGGKPDAVTSVSFCPCPQSDGSALLALGLESGRLELWNVPSAKLSADAPPPSLNVAFPANFSHKATVTKLAWRPLTGSETSTLTLASCSMDHGCRLFEIDLGR